MRNREVMDLSFASIELRSQRGRDTFLKLLTMLRNLQLRSAVSSMSQLMTFPEWMQSVQLNVQQLKGSSSFQTPNLSLNSRAGSISAANLTSSLSCSNSANSTAALGRQQGG